MIDQVLSTVIAVLVVGTFEVLIVGIVRAVRGRPLLTRRKVRIAPIGGIDATDCVKRVRRVGFRPIRAEHAQSGPASLR